MIACMQVKCCAWMNMLKSMDNLKMLHMVLETHRIGYYTARFGTLLRSQISLYRAKAAYSNKSLRAIAQKEIDYKVIDQLTC
jgi:hypothetical protein